MAAVIFGGWDATKTVDARYFVVNMAPSWFRNFYIRNGEGIAEFISTRPFFKAALRPMFEVFAAIGKKERAKQ